MDLYDTGMTCPDIASELGLSEACVYRRFTVAMIKIRVAEGAVVAPLQVRFRDDEESPSQICRRIIKDIEGGLRCPSCYVVLKGSDCEEYGRCYARAPGILVGDAIPRIGALWSAVELGRNARE